jgi:hypothetical protein
MGVLSRETEDMLRRAAEQAGQTPDALLRRLLAEAAEQRGLDLERVAELRRSAASRPLRDGRPIAALRTEIWEG